MKNRATPEDTIPSKVGWSRLAQEAAQATSPRVRRSTNPKPSAPTDKPPPVAAVVVVMAVVGLVIGLTYRFTAAPMFPNCKSPYESFLGPTYQGGVAAAGSLKTAALFGVGLWMAAAALASWLRRWLAGIFVAYLACYIGGLVVLWYVSPMIWGPRLCV
jgi:hypothetical protein